jgi:hypothetical protein
VGWWILTLVNDHATIRVRPGRIRSGSAIGTTRPLVPTHEAPSDRVDRDAQGSAHPGLFDWVPTSESVRTRASDYPIEGGVPHPHWLRGPAEHGLATRPVVVAESALVVRLLIALAIAAFLLGLTVFYPVSPLGH